MELTHPSVVAAFPLEGRPGRFLLAWTTTPWPLPANVALAVHPELAYEGVQVGDRRYYVAAAARPRWPAFTDVRERLTGADLVGLRYASACDDLPAQRGVAHRVVAWDTVAADEGTGIVHIAAAARRTSSNAVWLDEALDRMGPDAVRYLFAAHPMADPIRFGEGAAREVTRRFLTLWNVLGLFVTYANLDRPALAPDAAAPRPA